MYAEFAHDPKVQMMSEVMQRRYIMIMCMRCSNALVTLHETEIAFHLRVTETELAETKALFVSKGFIDNAWNLLNWEKRQFVSDRSAPRVAKHRALQKAKQQLPGNDDVTLLKRKANALDTDTDTDTDKKNTAPRCVAPPVGVSPVVWTDFQKLRKTKKAPITETSLAGIKREAEKAGWRLEDALQECCTRGWQSFKADWVAGSGQPENSVFAGAI